MVTANTFRNPGLVAKMAATVDHVSDGRVILGLGARLVRAGARRVRARVRPVDSGERIDRLGRGDRRHPAPARRRARHPRGPHYRLHDAVCAPRPVQAHLPILLGGSGPQKTLPLVARHADMWNLYGSPDRLAAADAVLRSACAAIGRDEAEIERTVNLNVVVRGSRAEAEAAWADWARAPPPIDTEKELNAGGTVEEVAAQLRRYRDIGFRHPVLIFRTPFDLETMDRLPELRAALVLSREHED